MKWLALVKRLVSEMIRVGEMVGRWIGDQWNDHFISYIGEMVGRWFCWSVKCRSVNKHCTNCDTSTQWVTVKWMVERVKMSAYLSAPAACPHTSPRLYICLSIYSPICLSASLSICLSTFLSVCLSTFLSVCLCAFLSVLLSYLKQWQRRGLKLKEKEATSSKKQLWSAWGAKVHNRACL